MEDRLFDPARLPRMAAALQGLYRARAGTLSQRLTEAHEDSSRLVVRQALQHYRRSTEALDPHTLHNAISRTPAANLRNLVSGARLLEKWDALELLVRLTLGSPAWSAVVNKEADRWRSAVNRRFTAAPPVQLARLRDLIERILAREAGPVWREIALILMSA